MRLYVVAGKVTDSVTYGFLPAAAALGLRVTLLTNRPGDHAAGFGEILGCDVADYREIIATIAGHHPPDAIFSNSDHLQAATALAAAYFDLPGKSWQAATHTKNKALMRHRLGRLGLDSVFFRTLPPGTDPITQGIPYPVVIKPREGVASEDVFLASDAAELTARCQEIQRRRPGESLLVEEYLPGELHTLETLGDDRGLTVLGSFHTTVSEPPYFIEERLTWAPPPEADQVLRQLTALGVGFGACHTEYVVSSGRARLVEVNYRIIGDHCDFLLADLLGVPLFELVLRVHLGDPAPPPPAPTSRHAIVDSVLADRSGKLTSAPASSDTETGGVRLVYRPMRTIGDSVTLTHTNRDYLGAIRAIGPGQREVEAAVRDFRSHHRWEIT